MRPFCSLSIFPEDCKFCVFPGIDCRSELRFNYLDLFEVVSVEESQDGASCVAVHALDARCWKPHRYHSLRYVS